MRIRSQGYRLAFWAASVLVVNLLLAHVALATCPDSNGGSDAKCFPGEGTNKEDCPDTTRAVSTGASGGGGGVDRHGCGSDQVCCEQLSTAEKTETGATASTSGCPTGQTHPKPSGGIGHGDCALDSCLANGYTIFTSCLSPTECSGARGTPFTSDDGKTIEGWGCDTSQYVCCKAKKNRCNDAATDSNKVYLCTTASQCTTVGGTPFSGGPSGCTGDFGTCCEMDDAPDSAMPKVGATIVPGLEGDAAGGGTGNAVKDIFVRSKRQYREVNAFCFTEDECSKASAVGNWVKGMGCGKKGNLDQGYCKAPVPQYTLQYPIGSVTTVAGLKNFIGVIFNYAMGIIILVAAVLFIYGGFRYLFSAVANDIQKAKSVMVDALVGLALGLGAYTILANVNFNTIQLRSFDVWMQNRLSFIDVVYCKEVQPVGGKPLMFGDAGTPTAPKDFDPAKGYTLTLDKLACGEEYFVDGGDSLSTCVGEGCGGSGNVCLSCISGIPSNCQSTSEHEHACVDKTKLQIVGKVNSKNDLIDIGVKLYCLKKEGASYSVSDSKDVSDDEDFKTSPVGDGMMGAYTINSLERSSIQDFDKDCTSGGGITKGAIRAKINLSGWTDSNFIVTKAHCGTDLFGMIERFGTVVYSPMGINCVAGERNWFTTFASAMEMYSKGAPAAFEANYVAQAWSAADLIQAADHSKIISCNFNAVGTVNTAERYGATLFCSSMQPFFDAYNKISGGT